MQTSPRLLLFVFLLRLGRISSAWGASPPSSYLEQQQQQDEVSFRPSVAIVVGIFSIMFSLTFLLLLYAKFCYSAAPASGGNDGPADAPLLPDPRFSGLDKSVIDSLPFFRFSSLGGSKHGLECAVCLSPFAGADLLRLLPGCKHAFHLHCVDRWLESHSSCPLCRTKVQLHDLTSFLYSTSSRSLFHHHQSELDVDLYVERELQHSLSDLRLHKIKHRVVVSDVVFMNRWSDLNSSDLITLNSDMLRQTSSSRFDSHRFTSPAIPDCSTGQFSIKEEMERKRAVDRKAVQLLKQTTSSSSSSSSTTAGLRSSVGMRSSSEITAVPRALPGGSSTRDENIARLWLPIARRTIRWLNGRDHRPPPTNV